MELIPGRIVWNPLQKMFLGAVSHWLFVYPRYSLVSIQHIQNTKPTKIIFRIQRRLDPSFLSSHNDYDIVVLKQKSIIINGLKLTLVYQFQPLMNDGF